MTPAAFANLLAYALQIALLVAACAGIPRLLRVRSPGALFVFWRAVAAACLLLPFVQPWKHTGIVAATAGAGRVADRGALTADPGVTISTLSAVWDPFVSRAIELVILAGIVTHLAWLAAGVMRLRRLRRRTASALTTAEFDDLQETIGTRATIRWTDAVPFPVTFGWRSPVVLLPSKVRRLDAAAARAVVAHELFHVRRRDWPWQIAEEALRAIFWFHPAMWWLISRLQLARETVVDELSILATNARRAYMDALLSFADESLLSPASAFSRRRHLFHRIVLLSREGSMSTARLASASLVLCAALAGSAAVAVAAFPLVQAPRDPVPGQLSPEQRVVLQRSVDRAREALVREPAAPDLHHRLAAALWARTVRDPQLTDAERIAALREAVTEEDAALRVRPDYLDALRFKSMLLGAVAGRTADPAERSRALADASGVDAQASAAEQGTSSGDPFSAEVAQLHALKVGAGIRPPTRIHGVHPDTRQTPRLRASRGSSSSTASSTPPAMSPAHGSCDRCRRSTRQPSMRSANGNISRCC